MANIGAQHLLTYLANYETTNNFRVRPRGIGYARTLAANSYAEAFIPPNLPSPREDFVQYLSNGASFVGWVEEQSDGPTGTT